MEQSSEIRTIHYNYITFNKQQQQNIDVKMDKLLTF